MKTLSLTALLCLIFLNSVWAQQEEHHFHDIDSVSHGSFNANEAHSLQEWFQKGHTSGLLRSNAMITGFTGETQHAALALGGRLYYHTAYWKGFQAGIGGIYTYNVLSSDLDAEDYRFKPRWTRQLFDITDFGNRHDLDRLEELFIKYRFKDSYIKLGKMVVNSPFVNPQDSRMKPSAFQGLWFDFNEDHQFEVNGGYFIKSSPRSTTEWFPMVESMNIYENDTAEEHGQHSLYRNGLLLIGGHYKFAQDFAFHNWVYYLRNEFLTNFSQLQFDDDHLLLGAQLVFQNREQISRFLFSTSLGTRFQQFSVSFNNTINRSEQNIYFPSEWGAEPYYTYISRHRVNDIANFTDHMLKIIYRPLAANHSTSIGFYASLTNEINSDQFTDAYQYNIDLRSKMKGAFNNFDMRLLITYIDSYTEASSNTLTTSAWHSQFILNYQF